MILWRFLIFVVLLSTENVNSHFEFNNVKCLARDPTFLEFPYCLLRSVNRTYKYFSLKARFFNFPVQNAWVNIKLVKRENRIIFDRFNITIDVCRFLKYRNNPVANMLYETFEEYSNMNHTCPYDHDVMIEKLPIDHINSVVQGVIPDGRYMLNTSWSVSKIKRFEVIVYFTKS